MTDSPSPHSSDALRTQTRTSIHRRLTWRDVAASLAMALAMPALVWAIHAPVQALGVTAAVAVAVFTARAVKRRTTPEIRPARGAVERIVKRMT